MDLQEQRVVLFVDAQNMYKGAREAFFDPYLDHFTCGQFNPLAMAELICSRPQPYTTRTIQEVRVYTGQPSSFQDPKGYAANRKQCRAWEAGGITVIARPLKYHKGKAKPEEKGIDVQLAIDYISLAIDGDYDVGIIASRDTDLKPALDFVLKRHGDRCRVEVMAWQGGGIRLDADVCSVWCHFLTIDDYNTIDDPTNYAQ